jgi:hypothetical protein
MRTVMEALERAGLSWYITGSEALAAYGSPRQTMDVDVVVDASADEIDALARSLADTFYYSEPLRLVNRTMAALVDRGGAGKVDLIVRDADAWGRAALERRRRWDHPTLGSVWISSLEDLVLAKLEWSEGSSELQLRDCQALLRMNAGSLDADYLDEWASRLRVGPLLRRAREDAHAS